MRTNSPIAAILWVVLLAAIAPQATVAAQDQPVTLAWKFHVGDTYKLQLKQSQSLSMDLGPAKIESSDNTSTWITWRVSDVADSGEATVVATIDRVKREMVSNGQTSSFDSASGEQPVGQDAAVAKVIEPILNAGITQRMNSQGHISHVELSDKAKNAVAQSGKGYAEAIESISKNSSLEFPDKRLVKGDHWTRNFTTPSPIGNMNVSNTYTYQGVETIDGKALHRFNIDVQMKFENPAAPAEAKFDISKQSTVGTLYFDAERGFLDHSVVEQRMEMNVQIKGQTIKQLINSKAEARFRAE